MKRQINMCKTTLAELCDDCLDRILEQLQDEIVRAEFYDLVSNESTRRQLARDRAEVCRSLTELSVPKLHEYAASMQGDYDEAVRLAAVDELVRRVKQMEQILSPDEAEVAGDS